MDLFALLFSPAIFAIVAAIVVVLILIGFVNSRYKIAQPDEAIIVTGRRARKSVGADGRTITDLTGQKVVQGGGVFVIPFLQKQFSMSLRSRAIGIQVVAQTRNGVTIRIEAVAVVKVGDSDGAIRSAAQRFLGQDQHIEPFTQEVLSGSLRSSIGNLTVEEIIRDRAGLAEQVIEAARTSLLNQGLDVDTFQIKEIADDKGYITDLGRPEQARVRQAAEIAESVSARASEQARIEAAEAIADANRELSLKNASIKSETDKALAEAEAAKPLAEAFAQQGILQQREITAQRETALREQQLNADVRKTADAESYRIRQIAEAHAAQVVAEAKADRDRRIAEAEATRAEGEAEAAAIFARGEAEARATELRVAALRDESEALLQQRAIEILPEIAKQLAAPYGAIDNLTVISTDGASHLSKQVVGNVTEVTQLLKDSTGIDLASLLGGYVGGRSASTAAGAKKGVTAEAPAAPASASAAAPDAAPVSAAAE
ncbi:flotillin family protein [Mycetocola zhujimingii]|uniref:flotillin family protein n=1 Tax=Mycetocola zhujimingii TaxID=2079792 RepID=UPI000D3B0817|nr:flotillin family protein [Mycetocola zhujimingii]AWB87756.1 flotillin family protein [Mycetocola zhujimingii]